jgi:hypothetical protein
MISLDFLRLLRDDYKPVDGDAADVGVRGWPYRGI